MRHDRRVGLELIDEGLNEDLLICWANMSDVSARTRGIVEN